MIQEIVYIKFPLRVLVNHEKIVLKDIGTIYCVNERLQKILEELVLIDRVSQKNSQYAVSIMKVIAIITKFDPNLNVVNLGEEEFLVEYQPEKAQHKALEYIKTAFVAAIIFFGAAFSIMTFNTDVSVSDVFDNVYNLIMGDSGKGKGIIEFTYSLGLPIGILVFFNHFSKKKVRRDPTPIQIEMRKYEKDVENAILSDASREGKTIDID
ncbi:stage V sporulation protein AA [Anaerosporobacter sp.]